MDSPLKFITVSGCGDKMLVAIRLDTILRVDEILPESTNFFTKTLISTTVGQVWSKDSFKIVINKMEAMAKDQSW